MADSSKRSKPIKMVHIAKTPKGYLLVDATGASMESASFAPASEAKSEQELRAALAKFSLPQEDVDRAVAEVHKAGHATISLDA
jgi:hypothetical protein